MVLKNLKKVIKDLNADSTFMIGEHLEKVESPYHFMYVVKKDSILIYDRNEYFNKDIDEQVQNMAKEASREFGFEYKTPESTELRILSLFEKALKGDLGKKVEIDWLDSVTLIVGLED